MSRAALVLCLGFACCVPCFAQQMKATPAPGVCVLSVGTLTIDASGTITFKQTPLTLVTVSGPVPTPPGPTPTPPPGPVLNARAQAVLAAVPAIAADPARVQNAAGLATAITQTKAMIVQTGITDATTIGNALKMVLSMTAAKLPAAWKPLVDTDPTVGLIARQFNTQVQTDSSNVLTVFDDVIAGLSAAAPGYTFELPFVIDPKTGKTAVTDGGQPIANEKHAAARAAGQKAASVDWITLITKLLPLIMEILQMFLSAIQSALPWIAALV